MTTTAVLLSGGVDSSVALKRLREEGVPGLTAFYLKIWLEDELAFLGRCPWQDDLDHARRVCSSVGVPLEVVSLQREYLERVVEHVLDELRRGRTPSPDVLCNRRIKFAAFLERLDRDVSTVVSGHHARTVREHGMTRLLKGADAVKDQSYFLSQLRQEQLARCRFPVGHLTKDQVRALARTWRLSTADRPDSQGICFLGRIPYDEFVRHHLGERPGDIRDADTGRVLGRHRGFWFHTIGQRRGLGLAGGPWYVVDKEVDDDVVWVIHANRLQSRSRDELVIRPVHWIAVPPSDDRLEVRLRHGPRTTGCRVARAQGDGLAIRLAEPDPGVAPGQYAVLYQGEECLGGGPVVRSPADRR